MLGELLFHLAQHLVLELRGKIESLRSFRVRLDIAWLHHRSLIQYFADSVYRPRE